MKHAISIDLGATNIRAALIDQRGNIVSQKREPTNKKGNDGIIVTNQIIQLVQAVMKEHPEEKIEAIGISSMGPLDHTFGGTRNAPNVPYKTIPLVEPLEKEFNLPVSLYKDTHAAVLAEKQFGYGKDVRNLVYITLSTGIGGGVIIDNQLQFGRGGNAAEIGHLIVDTTYKIQCTCKKGYGHWEGLASGRNIARFFNEWSKVKNTGTTVRETKEVFDRAKEGDKPILDFLDELAKINARAISDIIIAYDPELIVIGGSVALNNPEFALDGILKYVDHYLNVPSIKITRLGDEIGLLGAAAAILQD